MFEAVYRECGTQLADWQVTQSSSEGRRPSFRYLLVLVPGPTTHAYSANHSTIPFQRDATGEDHDAAAIRNMYAEELVAGLRKFGQFFRRNVERPRSECLVDRNVNAAEPCTFHTLERDQVGAFIHHGDVHGL